MMVRAEVAARICLRGMLAAAALGWFGTMVGCPSDPGCTRNSDCAAGNYCSGGACIQDCTSETVADRCPAGSSCSTFGMCVTPPDAGPISDSGARDAPLPPTDGGAPCVSAGGTDADGDGFCAGGTTEVDCDDADAAIHPWATEICTPHDAAFEDRAVDEDCDGAIDEGCAWHFGTPHPVLIGAPDAQAFGVESPRLSADGLRLYVRGGLTSSPDPRVGLVMSRTSTNATFGPPEPVPGLGFVPTYVSSFSVSRDETEVYTQVRLAGPPAHHDVYRATRGTPTGPFGPASAVTELNDPVANDYHPYLRMDALELLFVSARSGTPRLYRATRNDSHDTTWRAPEQLHLGTTESITGEASPSLSEDGLTLFFARDLALGRVVFMARRASSDVATFTDVVEVTDLNYGGAVSLFATVSERTAEVFFVSNRAWSPGAGGDTIWRARICRDAPCPNVPIACPSAARSPDGLHCYTSSPAANYGTVRGACSSLGDAFVVEIHSAAEQAFVWDTFGTASGIWLGLEQTGAADVFAWRTGAPLVFGVWAPGEPNPGAEESQVAMTAAGTPPGRWFDISGSPSIGGVCEAEVWPTW